jgi:hypothetical protein
MKRSRFTDEPITTRLSVDRPVPGDSAVHEAPNAVRNGAPACANSHRYAREHEGLVRRVETRSHRRLPLPRFRHAWARWHVQNGTPPYALQEMGGWASSAMVRRYAPRRGAPGVLAERLAALRVVASHSDGTNIEQA